MLVVLLGSWLLDWTTPFREPIIHAESQVSAFAAIATIPEQLELDRIALAVEAVTVGCPSSVLIHVDHPVDDASSGAPISLVFTPLEGSTTIAQSISLLDHVSSPRRWELVGIVAPTQIRLGDARSCRVRRCDAWMIQLVSATGSTAGRIAIPDAPECSGPIATDHHDRRLIDCLARLLYAR